MKVKKMTKIAPEDIALLQSIKDQLWPLLEKIKKASKEETNPKAKDYFDSAFRNGDISYVRLGTVLWYLASGFNFQSKDEWKSCCHPDSGCSNPENHKTGV